MEKDVILKPNYIEEEAVVVQCCGSGLKMTESPRDGNGSPGTLTSVAIHKSREGPANNSLSNVYHPLQFSASVKKMHL